jgi:hypothetical protein
VESDLLAKEIPNMTSVEPIVPEFQEGEAVVLAKGTYQGTTGTFLHLRNDPNWADIEESDGDIWSHPVAWLDHSERPAAQ